MYAVKNFAIESDFYDYQKALSRENNNRAREWVVKSLPYTMHRDVPYLLADEILHPFFTSDPLFAESVITALGKYMDLEFISDKIVTVIRDDQDDLVILSAINNLIQPNTFYNQRKINDLLFLGYNSSKNMHIKLQIGMYLINQFSPLEVQTIYNIIKTY